MKKFLSILLSAVMAISMLSIGFSVFAADSDLTLGQISTVTIESSGSRQVFTYTPERSGYYIFRSHASSQSKIDPNCVINDSSGNPVGDSPFDDYTDPETGFSMNFHARVYLEAGKQYSFICALGSYVGVTYPVSYDVDLNSETPAEPEDPDPEEPEDPVELGTPADIEITARGGDGERARIDWTAAEGATRYEVYDITKGKNVLKGETTDPYFIFDDLTPGWTYEVKVIAYNDAGDSAESESYTFGAACPTVQNLRAEATGTNTIKAQWNVTTSHGYYLQWSTTPDFSSDVNGTYISGTNSTSYTITTSKPADQYYVRVRAYKLFELGGTIYGAFTDAVSLAGQLMPVTGIELTARGGDGERARIDWNESAGATRYEVYDITKGKNVLKGETTDPYFIFDDLTPGWTYEVKVIAYNDEGDSAESESYTFGAACPTVQEISASLADTNTIDVEWSETTSHGYYLQWSTTSDFSGDVSGTYISGTSSTSYTIKTSKSADLYYVRVRAYKLFELGGTIYGAFTQPVDIMGIEITARGGDGERARIDWNDTEGAVKYEVYDITKGKNVLKGTTIDPYFVFDDLTPGWTYEVKIIAYDSSNKKLYESESYTFGAACPTVQNLRAEATGTNTIEAEWDVTTSHGYYLQWSTTSDFSSDVYGTYISGTNSTSYTITTSKPADQYYVRVRAYKLFELGGTIYGAFTQAISISTGYAIIPRVDSNSITAVTFNCAAPWGSLLDGTYTLTRVNRFSSYMNTVKPDIIGTQEMNQTWLNRLETLMSDYDSYGVLRGGDSNSTQSEMNAVFWLKDKYTALDKGTFWLSETPDVASRYEGAGCNRICTWVLLENNETEELLLHMNTHLDNSSDAAANFGAELIMQRMEQIIEEYPEAQVVITGDLNQVRGMYAYNTISAQLNDTLSAFPDRADGTYQNWGEYDRSEPIDFIFVSDGFETVNYKILDDIHDGYVSDHYGVYAEISGT